MEVEQTNSKHTDKKNILLDAKQILCARAYMYVYKLAMLQQHNISENSLQK